MMRREQGAKILASRFRTNRFRATPTITIFRATPTITETGMTENSNQLVVVGQGAAGLSAALAAAESARRHGVPLRVTLLEKAAEDDAGGNTRWTPAYMRMAAPDRVEPSFVHDMLEATRGQGDEGYFARLASDAPATVAWIAAQGVEFHQPTYYLAKGPPRIQPVGGGAAIYNGLSRAAQAAGVTVRYSCAARVAGDRERPHRRRRARRRRRSFRLLPWCSPAAASRATPR